MINNFLKKQWEKIEYTKKVISVINIAHRLSSIHDIDYTDIMKTVKEFYKNIDETIFVNDNQVIDIKPLYKRNIADAEELIWIIKNEYFIMETSYEFPLDYFKKKNMLFAYNKDTCMEVSCICETKKSGILDYPKELFKKFYIVNSKWKLFKDSNIVKVQLISKYLEYKREPKTIYDIYQDLLGALLYLPIEEILKVLIENKKFTYLYDGYWASSIQMQSIEYKLMFAQLTQKQIFSISLKGLLESYLQNSKTTYEPIERIIDSFYTININPSCDQVIEEFLKLGYLEIYPGYWTKNVWEVEPSTFNLTKVWNQTRNKLLSSIKNDRNKTIFHQRIIGQKTLETVGKEIGVTRERVRQIEKSIRNKMKHNTTFSLLRPFYDWVKSKLTSEIIIDLEMLGVCREEYETFDFIMNCYIEDNEICRLCNNIIIYKSELDRLKIGLRKINKTSRIVNIKDIPFRGGLQNKIELYNRVFTEALDMVALGDNNYFYVGRKPTKEEEIYMVIYKLGRPIHFTEVHKQAEALGLTISTNPGRNVLATMQRNNLLRRVAPGTYAIKEWDIPKHIYITDLIYKVLNDANRPMYYEELLAEIKRNRLDKIKEKSVQYYLAYHDEVIYIYTKQYILSEWAEDLEWLNENGIDIKKVENNTLLYKSKVILDVFKKGKSYITKYRFSEASSKSSSLRISRYVEFDFNRRITVIDLYGGLNFNSYSSDVITGINQWGYVPKINEEFYMEYINQKVARFLKEGELNNYRPIEADLLKKAEQFWEENMAQLLLDEEKDEEVISEINTLEDLIDFGFKSGYVYYETIEKLVDEGYNPRELLYELNDRGIIVNY